MFIPDPGFEFFPSRIRIGVKKAPDPGSTGTVPYCKISVKDPDLRLFEDGKFVSLLGRIQI
jgi:hypothetical protein